MMNQLNTLPSSTARVLEDIIEERFAQPVTTAVDAAELRNKPVLHLAYLARYIGSFTKRSELVRAAALLVAAIETLDKEGQ